MKCPIWLTIAALALPSTVAVAQISRDQQMAACSGDALKLCGDAIPDEERIVACMSARRSSLSDSCRVVFDGSAPLPAKRRR